VNSEPRTVYRFEKNTREQVRATLTEFGGHPVADLRVWVGASDGEPQATRKGLTLRVEQLPELIKAVEALIQAEAGKEASP
jgi:Transcriptional Coactivator p15 (PC4)